MTSDRRGSGILSTRFFKLRASVSEIGTSWRQQAPQPFLHEISKPCSLTCFTVASIIVSATERKIGSIRAAVVGPVGTDILMSTGRPLSESRTVASIWFSDLMLSFDISY